MQALIIPDVHLKPWMFDRAAEIMRNKEADLAVCLMDIADDWGQERNVGLYVDTPMKEITRENNIISCDVFSTYRDGSPYGTCEFPIIDTETWEWEPFA